MLAAVSPVLCRTTPHSSFFSWFWKPALPPPGHRHHPLSAASQADSQHTTPREAPLHALLGYLLAVHLNIPKAAQR